MTSPSPTSRRPFAEAAVAAFPRSVRPMAREAARDLAAGVDDSYRQRSYCMDVSGEAVHLPYRLHFRAGAKVVQAPERRSPLARCLLSRSTDGHLRQAALRSILTLQEPWVFPFIVFPIGEYVVEIVEDIRSSIPMLDRAACANFVRENRTTMRVLRAKAMSYWDCYYRNVYPDRRDYPGIVVLNELERWAS